MDIPKIKTKVVHSESKTAWNVVGTVLGGRYKIARIPYHQMSNMLDTTNFNEREKKEAFEIAMFISTCFNAAYDEDMEKENEFNALREKYKNYFSDRPNKT